MLDERQLIQEFETADPNRLVSMLVRLAPGKERVLHAFLGKGRVQKMRALAWKATANGEKKRRRMVLVPGFGASALISDRGVSSRPIQVWPDRENALPQGIDRLRLGDDGRQPADGFEELRPAAVLNRWYGELVLKLAAGWDVGPFAYDWRKDLTIAVVELDAFVESRYGREDFSVVAHSTGGRVVRDWLRRRAAAGSRMPSRVVLLGSLHRGTWRAARILAGGDHLVKRWDRVSEVVAGLRQSGDRFAGARPPIPAGQVLASFVSLYQLIPPPGEVTRTADVDPSVRFDVTTYRRSNPYISSRHLAAARAAADLELPPFEPVDISAIAGYGCTTLAGPTRTRDLAAIDSYALSLEGDGVVTTTLADARDLGAPSVGLIESAHGDLVGHPQTLELLDDLLEGRSPNRSVPRTIPREMSTASPRRLLRMFNQERSDQDLAFEGTVRRLGAVVARTMMSAASGTRTISPDEWPLEEILTGGFLGTGTQAAPMLRPASPAVATPRLRLRLAYGSLEKLYADALGSERCNRPATEVPDVFVVSLYQGTLPSGVTRAVERVISRALAGLRGADLALDPESTGFHGGFPDDPGPEPATDDPPGVLTTLIERGQITAELGQIFILPEPIAVPRAASDEAIDSPIDRLVAVTGMGPVGRCGPPELNVLVRELLLTLSHFRRRHVASVLTGGGVGNISLEMALHAWIHGLSGALRFFATSTGSQTHPIETLTLVERDPSRLLQIDRLMDMELNRHSEALSLDYDRLDDTEIRRLRDEARVWKSPGARRNANSTRSTRMNVSVARGIFRFGALTDQAAVPERQINIPLELVRQASQELIEESNRTIQLDRGQFLSRLLIPQDLRSLVFTEAPLVVTLDRESAQVPWEMLAHWPLGMLPAGVRMDSDSTGFSDEGNMNFLGMSYGLTRQLEATFASPPTTPASTSDLLRVLVVADPAEDAPLPGAQSEGVEVANLFESWDRIAGVRAGRRVEVARLFGPIEATLTNVLRAIVAGPYDILHFAGHTVYERQQPEETGWLFSKGQRFTAAMLERVDRVPPFVFCNSCESGVLPQRVEGRSPELPVTLAEQFLAKGVANFVVTGWPVDDQVARAFAVRIYSSLLGLPSLSRGGASLQRTTAPLNPVYIHQAMSQARAAVARLPGGISTWGAYQHYGSPFFRLLESRSLKSD